ncbi:SdrD B-like domain-containing protein [Microbacterium sp. LWH12-1.2]|uniref:SdrD B-like domain-containing protein n=1 Tax=Microbacterium sp. LWH12-1.2 TaxID=3135259 RepID=UPI0034443D15
MSAPASAASGTVTGMVFRDLASNGVFDSDPLADQPLAGVTVTAYDSAGAAVGTAQSAADGTYTLDVVDAATDDVRVQFTGVPAGYEPASHGAGNGTSVQFVTIGATDVDYGVNAPDDYSQGGSVPLALPIRWTGLRDGFSTAERPSIVSVPWDATLNGNGEYDQRTTLAEYSETGSLWGTAYRRTTGDLFSSATLQRHSDLGPLGLGGIYLVPNALNEDGTLGTPGAVEEWLDVQGLPIAGGGTVDLGESTIDWDARGLNGPTNPAHDTQAYDAIGKIGIGDIEVSSDQKTLYFVNLFDKNLYAIDIANPTEATRIPLNLAEGERPWAIEVHHGQVYIGYVQTGEGNGNAAVTDQQLFVRAASDADLTPLGTAGSQIFATGLDYVKGSPGSDGIDSRFFTWKSWTTAADYDRDLYSFANLSDPAPMMNWSQAMLTDLTFTTEGNLVLGLADRSGWQLGNENYGPLDGQTDLTQGVSAGDTLVAGVQGDGSYVLENDGVVGDLETSGTLPNQGPGGREFIDDSFINASNDQRQHNEITLGGLASIAGFEDVVTTAMDPTEGASRTGIRWSSATDGSNSNGYQVTQSGHEGSFEKSGGLGDLQALVNAAPVEIGNRVWFDADRDGIQDAGEPAVPGVTVTLLDEGGQPVAGVDPVVTDASGEYYFSDIAPDLIYTVAFDSSTADVSGLAEFGVTEPSQLSWTGRGDDAAAATREIDSNVDPANGRAPVTVGGPGHNDHTIDAGLIVPPTECTVGDFVWVDANENGLQDQGEAGVAGATVELLDAEGNVVDTTTTDANGAYLFEGIDCGTYRVRFTIAEGNTFTTPGAGDDTAVDSNPTPTQENPLVGVTPEFEVTPENPEDLTIDAGIVPESELCTVGDFVWVDANENGIQDAGEAGVEGATVELLDAEGNVVDTTTTDAAGAYLFEDVECTTYSVRFTIPEGHTFTSTATGDDRAVDSNPTPTQENPLVGVTPQFEVTPQNREDLTIDAGVVPEAPLCTVGDFVWVDADADGVQDAGEAGVAGVTVELLNAEGDVVATVQTDANGGYVFSGVECATYRVRFTIPEGNTFTTPDAGDDTAVDSNPTPTQENPLIGVTPEFEVTPENPEDLTIDAGIVPVPEVLCTVGDFVWVDADADGVQDAAEAGVAGVTVELLDAEGNVIETATTDANGGYLFDDIECGTYRVRFTIPEGNTFTTPTAGDDTEVDSNPTPTQENPLVGVTPEFTVTEENNEDLTIDAGIVPEVLCTVGDFVWLDADRDGIQDQGEAPVAGVTVELLNAEGAVVATVTTDAAGAYLFDDIECGTYRVRFTIPEGNTFTTPTAGDDTEVDSNPTPSDENPLVGVTPEFEVTPENPEDLTIDAGIVPVLCTIGNFVWVDVDADGIQDDSEVGIAGVTVELLDAEGNVVETATTGADGSYLFEDVECGTYRVRFTLPEGNTFTTPDAGDDTAVDSNPVPTQENPLIGVTPEFEVTPVDPKDLTIDAGVVPEAPVCTIGDFVWLDEDRDGIQDAGEAGIAGVKVELLNAAGDVVATVTTGADGSYLFEGVECGTYRVRFTLPEGNTFTPPNAGDDETVDSNPTPTTGNPLIGVTPEFEVTPENQEDLTIDAGVVKAQPPLAITGGGPMTMSIVAGLMLLLIGGGLVALRRRRTASSVL